MFVAFLVFVSSFQNVLKRHLSSDRKTVNSQGYSRVTGANQHARKLLFTDLVNTLY